MMYFVTTNRKNVSTRHEISEVKYWGLNGRPILGLFAKKRILTNAI